jgi:hypothetical protein
MNFYAPNDVLQYLNEHDFECLMPAEFDLHRKKISLYQYSNGEIVWADDSFGSYFALLTGQPLPVLTNEEYRQYVRNKEAFLGDQRASNLWRAWMLFKEAKK